MIKSTDRLGHFISDTPRHWLPHCWYNECMNKMTVGAKKGGYLWAQQHRFILTKADITNVLNVQTDSNSDNTGPPMEPVLGAIICLLCAGVLQLNSFIGNSCLWSAVMFTHLLFSFQSLMIFISKISIWSSFRITFFSWESPSVFSLCFSFPLSLYTFSNSGFLRLWSSVC